MRIEGKNLNFIRSTDSEEGQKVENADSTQTKNVVVDTFEVVRDPAADKVSRSAQSSQNGKTESLQALETSPNDPKLRESFNNSMISARVADPTSPFKKSMLQDPAVRLKEDVKLPATLPGGESVRKGLDAYDLGLGKKIPTAPSSTGIDLSSDRMQRRDVVSDVLGVSKQAEFSGGSQPGNTSEPGIRTPRNLSLVGAEGDKSEGEGFLETVKNVASSTVDYLVDLAIAKFAPTGTGEAMTLLRAPEIVEKVTGDSTDLLKGAEAFGKLQKEGYYRPIKMDDKEFDNPDADPMTVPLEKEAAHMIETRLGMAIRPSGPDTGGESPTLEDEPIKDSRFFRPEEDPNPDGEQVILEMNVSQADLITSIHGPDTVNPKDGDSEPLPLSPPPDGPKPGEL